MSARTTEAETCLVIEDSSFDREKFKRILNKSFSEIRVIMASTLAEAREYVSANRPDLILLDNSLPDGNGANFAVELSEDDTLRKIPVIMVSDFPTPFMYQKAAIAGVRHVVDKSDFGARFIHDALRPAKKTPSRSRTKRPA
ncbi:response regulator [Roseobacter ponti]|uniref:Response regulator n=1 Tax=Roseobacter ponti TaxID=1891787 RepID=A0A858SPU1_9RHOB|nr:response regulator [Roseobacter ponti]QJF49868.1 response regulator [Roseobacter ponti]